MTGALILLVPPAPDIVATQMGLTPASKALQGGASIKERVVIRPFWLDNFHFFISFVFMGDLFPE